MKNLIDMINESLNEGRYSSFEELADNAVTKQNLEKLNVSVEEFVDGVKVISEFCDKNGLLKTIGGGFTPQLSDVTLDYEKELCGRENQIITLGTGFWSDGPHTDLSFDKFVSKLASALGGNDSDVVTFDEMVQARKEAWESPDRSKRRNDVWMEDIKDKMIFKAPKPYKKDNVSINGFSIFASCKNGDMYKAVVVLVAGLKVKK